MTSFRIGLLAAGSALILSACVPATPGNSSPSLPEPANDTCSARAAGHLIGQDAAALSTLANRRDPIRVLKPGQPMTMDYMQGRLNVELDDAGRIIRLFCG